MCSEKGVLKRANFSFFTGALGNHQNNLRVTKLSNTPVDEIVIYFQRIRLP